MSSMRSKQTGHVGNSTNDVVNGATDFEPNSGGAIDGGGTSGDGSLFTLSRAGVNGSFAMSGKLY